MALIIILCVFLVIILGSQRSMYNIYFPLTNKPLTAKEIWQFKWVPWFPWARLENEYMKKERSDPNSKHYLEAPSIWESR